MSEHTPGPWKHTPPPPGSDTGNPWMVRDRDSHILAIVPRSPRETNARLMAAAPYLLTALHGLLEALDEQVDELGIELFNAYGAGVDAIAKATRGES